MIIKNWMDLSKYGYPIKENGQTVSHNTYERAAWAAAGVMLIIENPIGIGIFRGLQIQMEQVGINFNGGIYTHSGWIDIGLAFGLPSLLFLTLCLLICLIGSIKNIKISESAPISFLSLSILILYLVGEYAFQHGIEMLIYFCTFISVLFLQLTKKIK